MSISAVVITYNEESNIDRCLASLSFADEIVVLDSFSTDRTVEFAQRFTDRVSQRKFSNFAEQKNAAIELASNDWVLVVDADEVVSEQLSCEIRKAVESDKFTAYKMPRLSYFLGQPIRHCGWYPDYVIKLMRKSKSHYPDRLVHETPEIDGRIGLLKNDLQHYSYRNLDEQCRKMLAYSRAAAKQKIRDGEHFKIRKLLFAPGLTFLKKYIVKQGFRDGIPGFVICMAAQLGVFLRYAMLWEMSICKERDNHDE